MPDRSRYVARAQFLGVQRIEIGGEVVTPEAELLFAMIVRLSVPLGRITSRQTMMETLWPGTDEANARHNLRQTVYKAREIGLVVESGEDGLRLDPRHWSCDWDDPDGDVGGEWLTGYATPFSEELGAWVSSQRVGVHALIRPRIVRALQRARSAGELALADQYAVQLLRIDELNEEATLTRAEVMAMHGAKVDALRLLDAYLDEIGRLGAGRDAALPASLLRRRIAEKLPVVTYQKHDNHFGQLVGRSTESKRLFAALFDARAGRGGAIVLHGREGSGKSRLIHETKKSAILQGMRILEFSVKSQPAAVPFSALRLLASRAIELPGALGVSPEALASLRCWLGDKTTAATDCPLAEIEDLLAAVSEETPMLAVIEHCEHMDDESLDYLDRLYRKGVGRYHMLVLTRSSVRMPAASRLTKGIDSVCLRPLQLPDMHRVVEQYAQDCAPRATADQIALAAVFADGIPMYGVEMLGLMLDKGSPDVIPWRVQVALDATARELSDLQCRVILIIDGLGESASLLRIQQALPNTEEQLAEAVDMIEDAGLVQIVESVPRVSALTAGAVKRRVSQSIQRADLGRAADSLEGSLEATESPTDFFSALKLLVAARQEDRARRLLDNKIGTFVRRATSESIIFHLSSVRDAAKGSALVSLADEIMDEVLRGSISKRPDQRDARRKLTPKSLPRISAGSIEAEYTLATAESLAASLSGSQNPSTSPASRIADAVAALAFAFNRDDDSAMNEAYKAFSAVRHAADVNPFDVCRAELIYHAHRGERDLAVKCAHALAIESRTVRNVELACKGFRNASEALSTFGEVGLAQALLHESRLLAASLGYYAQVIWADLGLADLSIDEMDADTARRYLESASRLAERHSLYTPLIVADQHLFRCWESLLRGEFSSAQRAAKVVSRTLSGPQSGIVLWTKISVHLATHRGARTAATQRDLETLRKSIGKRAYYASEQRSLASMLLYTRGSVDYSSTAVFVHDQFGRIQASGRRIWPFLESCLAEG